MCFALPMRIVDLDGFVAHCDARGVARTVNLFLLADESLAVGDYVLVHLDSAVRKIDPADAHATWAAYDEIIAATTRP